MRTLLAAAILLIAPSLASASDFTSISPTTANVFTTYTGDIVTIAINFDLGSGYYSTESYAGVVVSGVLYVYAPTGDQIYSGTPLNAGYVYYTRTVVGGNVIFYNAGANTLTFSGWSFGTRAIASPMVGLYGFAFKSNDPPPPPPSGPQGPAAIDPPPPPPPSPTNGPGGPAYVNDYLVVYTGGGC
jgi:hypothetical protein